jgi:hypothetical protein
MKVFIFVFTLLNLMFSLKIGSYEINENNGTFSFGEMEIKKVKVEEDYQTNKLKILLMGTTKRIEARTKKFGRKQKVVNVYPASYELLIDLNTRTMLETITVLKEIGDFVLEMKYQTSWVKFTKDMTYLNIRGEISTYYLPNKSVMDAFKEKIKDFGNEYFAGHVIGVMELLRKE